MRFVDASGKIIKWFGTSTDIEELKQAETALRASQEQIIAVMENLTEGITVGNHAGRLIYMNPRALARFGFASIEACRSMATEFGNTFEILPLTEDTPVPLVDWPMSRVLRGEVLHEWEIRLRRRDQGWEKNVACSGWFIHGASGELLSFVSTCDITERKQAEADLQEREEQLRLFIEYAPAALAMLDREMRYLSVSRCWRADYGLGDRDLRGVSHYEVFPEVPERRKAAYRRGLAGEVLREDDDHFETADGPVQSVAWQVRPWRNPRGGIGGIVILTENITERKHAQEALRLSEERLRLALRVAAMAIWELRLPTRTLIWAPEVRDIFGFPADAPQPSFEDAARVTPRMTDRESKNNSFFCTLESQFSSTTVSFGQTEQFVGLNSPAQQNSTTQGSAFDVSVSFGTSQTVNSWNSDFAKNRRWMPSVDFRVVWPMTSTIL